MLESRPAVRNGVTAASPHFSLQPSAFSLSAKGGFTILELMLVVGIIGLMAAMALPHLSGFTKGNTMATATRQLLDDVGLARQRALVNRSMVCMVFLPADFWTNDSTRFVNSQITNLAGHQYAAYALIAMRTVGDQPGVSNVHYITPWKYLPQGIYISPFQFTNRQVQPTFVSTTNTMIGLSNGWQVATFLTNWFPFPSTYNTTNSTYSSNLTTCLPYIGFATSGQLTTNADQFIMLTSGSIFAQADPSTGLPQVTWPPAQPNLVETPPGNAFNNPNLIHIDWLTGRARIERNQF
ncbi:MAG: Tfp pilus assembly protein FimT/FimU [Limisphaerales bacterium]